MGIVFAYVSGWGSPRAESIPFNEDAPGLRESGVRAACSDLTKSGQLEAHGPERAAGWDATQPPVGPLTISETQTEASQPWI